jgi:hypothetical protein
LPLSEKQIPKRRPAIFIEATNLAVEHGAFDSEMFGDPGGKLGETVKRVPVSRNQSAFAGLDVSQRAKAINLQF